LLNPFFTKIIIIFKEELYTMTKNQRLYNELRQFVDKQKVREYDNEFFAQKRLTYKFLIP